MTTKLARPFSGRIVASTQQHTAACLVRQMQAVAYRRAHHYCTTCRGWGFVQAGGDLVDYGETQVALPTYPEFCPDCVVEGYCPRCGSLLPIADVPSKGPSHVTLVSVTGPCNRCHWREGDDGEPLVDCHCGEV